MAGQSYSDQSQSTFYGRQNQFSMFFFGCHSIKIALSFSVSFPIIRTGFVVSFSILRSRLALGWTLNELSSGWPWLFRHTILCWWSSVWYFHAIAIVIANNGRFVSTANYNSTPSLPTPCFNLNFRSNKFELNSKTRNPNGKVPFRIAPFPFS